MWNHGEFRTRLNENSIRDFEKIMLASGQCSLFMPMGFMGSSEGETVHYDCSGFSSLSRYRIERTEDALYLLERVLLILGRSAEYLIAPTRITLSMDTVFYNKDAGEVKIAYVPLAGEQNLRKNIAGFALMLKRDICDGRGHYIDRVVEYVWYRDYYIREIINQIGRFRRKLYLEAKQN